MEALVVIRRLDDHRDAVTRVSPSRQACSSQGLDDVNALWPKQFDANEWFIIIGLCIVYFVVIKLPRRFPSIVTFVFFFIGLGIAMYVDFHFGIKPLDMYTMHDADEYEIFDLLTFLLYTPFAYLFVYFYDKWKLRGLAISLYVLAWSVGGVVLEALGLYFHVYNYKGWTLGLSLVFYLTSQSLTVLLYTVIKKYYRRKKKETGYDW